MPSCTLRYVQAKQAIEQLTANATNDVTLLLKEKEKELNAV